MTSKRNCVCCKKPKPIVGRGLCSLCYQAARLAVVARETTWEELERKGLALPKVVRSAFRQALLRIKK